MDLAVQIGQHFHDEYRGRKILLFKVVEEESEALVVALEQFEDQVLLQVGSQLLKVVGFVAQGSHNSKTVRQIYVVNGVVNQLVLQFYVVY